MIKAILLVGTFLVLSAKVRKSEGNISLGSCSLSCNENEDNAHDLIVPRGGLQGPPGKRGPMGQKGEHGIKGDAGVQGQSGPQGIPGSSCDCSRNDELATQVATLQQELNNLKGRVVGPGEDWSRASNNRWYKWFNHEEVNYETAKSRCVVFGAKLASAGLRTAALRSEIKRLLPSHQYWAWIGLDDLVSQHSYVWADGVASTSSNTDWKSGQPDRTTQRCVVLYSGQLYDDPCARNLNYLCEF